MNILIAQSFLEEKEITGISVYVSNLVAALKDRMNITILTLLPTRETAPEGVDEYDKENVHYMELSTSVSAELPKLSHGPVSWWIGANLSVVKHWQHIAEYIRQQHIDIVHLQDCFVASLIELCEQTNTKVVTTIHAVHPSPAHFGEALRHYQMAHSAAIIVVSRWMKDAIVSRNPIVEPEKLHVIYNGVQVAPVAPKMRRFITFAGRLVELKGVSTLLKAYARMVRLVEEAPLLVIMGDGPDRERLMRLANELGIAERVQFRGEVSHDEVCETLAESLIHVVPSRTEALGLSALEGMALGAAVIASDIEGLREVVQDGVSGLLFTMDHEEELAEKLVLVYNDVALHERLVEHAQNQVAKKFSWEAAGRQTESIFESLV